MENFGERLFELRKSKNLSQEDVADKLNVTRQSVSKWETNQSMPDLDKIVPLCDLFEVSTEELLTGNKAIENKEEKKILSKQEARRKSAEIVSSSVFIYIVATALFVVAIDFIKLEETVAVALFLCIFAWATARIIKHYMSIPKFEKNKEEKIENEVMKAIIGIVWCVCFAIYFVLSFLTMAWQFTWILFIIGALSTEIVKLIFMLKAEKKEANKNE